jgi:iron complex outermembrane receptor protein
MFTKTIIITAIGGVMLALFAGMAQAEISGVVIDRETGEPIAGAAVKVKGENIGGITGRNGVFAISGFVAEKPTLVAEVIGYDPAYKTVEPDASGVEFALEPKLLRGQDVIVTATRGERGETPAAFTNVSSRELRKEYYAQDIPVLLEDTPNLYAYSDAGNGIGYSYLKIRGFDQKRIAVMLNGVPLNDAVSGEVFWIDLPDFAESVQDIQIQRGVGNSLYGAAALGGSVNLVTSDYSTVPALNFKTGYGSYNTKKYLLSGNSGLIDDNYVFYGRFSRIETDGYRDLSWSRMWGYFLGAARYDENSTLKINFYGGPEESHLAYKGITAEQLEIDRKYNELQYKDEIDHFQQPHYELLHDYRFSDRLSLSNTLYYFQGNGYYDQFRSGRDFAEYNLGVWFDPSTWTTYALNDTSFPAEYYTLRDSLGNPLPDGTGSYPLDVTETDLVRRRVVNERDWGWIPRLSYRMDRAKIIAGGEMRLHTGHHFGEVLWSSIYPLDMAPNLRYYDYRGDRQSYTVFGHLEYNLTDRLLSMADIQYQYYRYKLYDDKRFDVTFERDYDFIAPRVGLNYRFADNSSVFANVSTASRQPAFKDIYDPTDWWNSEVFYPARFSGNEYIGYELNEEKLLDFELGAHRRFPMKNNRLDLGLNLYRMQIADEIVPYAGQVDDNGYPLTGNADKTIHQGVELSARFDSDGGFAVNGNVSINDDKFDKFTEYVRDWNAFPDTLIEYDRSGKRIGGFPVYLANYGVEYGYDIFRGRLSGRLVGEQYLDNSEDDNRKLDGYHFLDLALSANVGKYLGYKQMNLDFRVNNLLDAEYETAGYIEPDDGLPRYMVGADRNFFLSLDVGI